MRERAFLVRPPVLGEAGDVVHVDLVLLPVALPRLVVEFGLAHHDSLEDRLVFLRDAQQLAHALLTVQTNKKRNPNLKVTAARRDLHKRIFYYDTLN